MIQVEFSNYYTLYWFNIMLLGVDVTRLPGIKFKPTFLENYNNLRLTNLFSTKDLSKILQKEF